MTHKTYNELVGAIASRVEKLANEKLDDLRGIAGYGCDTHAEAVRMNKYESRGSLLARIILEEFSEENDVPFEE